MIVIPDIHGRTFWKGAVKGREKEVIVFLGDYMDPYPYERDIDFKSALKNFKEILSFKRRHMNNVILLLGNHDQHYLYDTYPCTRYDWRNWETITKLFTKYEDLFQLTYEAEINNKVFLFSHAGIRVEWLKQHNINVNLERGVSAYFNNTMKGNLKNDGKMIDALDSVSPIRGGNAESHGSLTWADVDEHMNDNLKYGEENVHPNVYQVFGHSQQRKEPIITNRFACLDVRRAFEINDVDGSIHELNVNENKVTPKTLILTKEQQERIFKEL